jgi:uncharacterized membrane protein HdeD (DUF308 family)
MFRTFTLINIGFPVYLVIFEIIFRTVSGVDTSSFVGPTLASSGMGLIINALKPRAIKLTAEIEEFIKKSGQTYTIRDPKDDKLVIIAWIAILIEIIFWYYSCALSIKNDLAVSAQPTIVVKNNFIPMILGVVNYVIGTIIISNKEE